MIHATDRDMHLRPDPSTVRIVPWATDPTAQVLHDCFDRDGKLIPFAPRSVLRHVCDLFAAEGWSPVVAPELEFYLIERNSDPNTPLHPPRGRSGRSGDLAPGLHSIDAVNEFDPLFEDIYAYCEQMELNVDTLIHEVGAGRWRSTSSTPIRSARRTRCSSSSAPSARPRCAMDVRHLRWPSRWANEPGSAMHVHQSLVDADGRNIFSNPDGSPSEFYWYIGGLRGYTPAAMALFAPYVNSYRRLARSTAAPINIQWGTDNRTVGIRSPVATPARARREPRHRRRRQPYVALAATLACGYLGIKNRIEPTPECKGDAYLSEYQLPRSLNEALGWLADEEGPARRAGQGVHHRVLGVKDTEYGEF